MSGAAESESEAQAFRSEVQAWLAQHCSEEMRTPMPEAETVWGGKSETFVNPASKAWLEAVVSKGWTCPDWPSEYGGAGLRASQNKILQQELRAVNARLPLMSYGIGMLAPALFEYGTAEQKEQHLPKMARGETRWCLGYSEPGAGSDLASAQTFAEDCGDHFRVNGSKVWSSYADQSDWILCIVRTSRDGLKHEGISVLMIDLESEGVTVKPIDMISGKSPFCETFFDNVEVPKNHLVGEVNKGWPIVKRLLDREREYVATSGSATAHGQRGRRVHQLAKDYVGEVGGQIADPVLRDKVASHALDARAFQLTLQRSGEESRRGVGNPAIASMFKFVGTRLNQRKYELMVECMGTQALGWEGEGFDEKELKVTGQWLRSKANSIEGGTSEIQLNIVSKRILNLPE